MGDVLFVERSMIVINIVCCPKNRSNCMIQINPINEQHKACVPLLHILKQSSPKLVCLLFPKANGLRLGRPVRAV